MPSLAFVAVHAGAGNHPQRREGEIAEACAQACEAAMDALNDAQGSTVAAAEAVRFLEDHPVTNAGFGSNLNRDGFVECDASIMEGTLGLLACIGAVPSTMSCSQCQVAPACYTHHIVPSLI